MSLIEPGCLAIVIGSNCSNENVGKVVRCLNVAPYFPASKRLNCPVWEIDRPLKWLNLSSNTFDILPFAPERYLMRIDGYEGDHNARQTRTDTNKRLHNLKTKCQF